MTPPAELTAWQPAPDRAAAIAPDADAVQGWKHTTTDEVVIRRPLLPDTESLPTYGVYWYQDVSTHGRGTNRTLLFRGDDIASLDERLSHWLESAPVPTAPDRYETALTPETIRRHELTHVGSLTDWGHYVGADVYQTEKIGMRKESSGTVALFEGSTRWGNGAYVALAAEHGPRGKQYVSVGAEPNGHYQIDAELGSEAFEITSPTVEFEGATITVTSSHDTQTVISAEKAHPPDE